MIKPILDFLKMIKEFSIFEIGIFNDGDGGEDYLGIDVLRLGTEDDDRSLLCFQIGKDVLYMELFWTSIIGDDD